MSILEWGRAVLDQESAALTRTAKKLDQSFVKAVDCILASRGKVIVTGLGKSGHVARKIAATLASTGTSAFYLHPSEALHGDSGMMQKHDCLLALAFSGETQEVLKLVEIARRMDLPVISITGKSGSALASASDFVLDGSIEKEADPSNIVPTCSSTVALALGDALAVALMRQRGFDETDFVKLHPGGSLGLKLARVRELMCVPNPLFLTKELKFKDILEKVAAENHGIIAVENQGQLAGVITDGDLRRSILKHGEKVFSLTAEHLMSTKPKIIAENALIVDALNLMEQYKITTVYVHAENTPNKIIGLLRMHDLVSAKII